MTALSDVDNVVMRDVEADGDARDDPHWRALLGQGRKRMRRKHLPGQHNQDSHGNDHGVDVPNPLDKLRGAGRIDLAPGERLLRSDRMRGENGRAWLAVTEKDGKRSLRIGLGNAQFGTRHDAHGPWRAGPDRTAEINEERAELRAEIEDLENEIEDLEDDPNADPADIAERREQLEKLYGAESGVEELPGGYTAMLDENSARRLRETLAKALDDGKKLQAELDKPYAELDRLTLERDKLKRGAFGRKFTAEEDAEWDRLTAEIARAEAELDPDSGPERPEQGYWTLAEGSIPGQWADVHYDIYLDDPSVGVEVKLGAVPHGSDMDFQDLTGNEMAASLAADEAADLVKLLAKMESGNGSKSSRSTAVKHGSHNQEDHGNRYGGIDLIPPMAGLPVLSSEEYERSYGDVLDERVVSSGDDVDLSVRVFENGDSHIVLDLKGGRHQVMSDFDDSDGMRALASDIRDMQRADAPDGEGSGDVVADADSTLHDYYVAKDDLGNIWLRTNDQDEDDYLELSDDEADDLETALDDMADSLDEHFEVSEEKSLKHPGHPDQSVHGRRKPKVPDVSVPDVPAAAAPAPKPRRAPKPKPASDEITPKPRRKPKPKPSEDEVPKPARRPRGEAAPAQGPAALNVPPRNLAAMTSAGDPRAEALWYRAGDNSLETDSGRPGSFEMSAQLRGSEKMTPEMRKRVKDIDSVMAESKLPEPILVYRGADKLGGVRPDEAIGQGRNLVGREFKDKSFVSTSTDAAHAHWFGGTVLRITAPAGTPAITMADRKGTERDSRESEILLDRGLTYRVVAQYGRGELKGDWGGAYVLDVEVVP